MSKRLSLILDACVLLNLLATKIAEDVLRAAAQTAFICVLVEAESLYLRNENDLNELEPVDLKPLIEAGVLQLCDVESEEEEQLFVNLAGKLDDGEAMSLAIALNRGWSCSTDDKKARRIFLENTNDEQLLLGTSDLIRNWAEFNQVATKDVKAVLELIALKSRFRPPVSDRNYQWWNDTMQS